MIVVNLLGIAAGLIALYFGAEWLVLGASRIARSFGISALIVGLTVVAFGTSTPELLVSLSAALSGSSDISLGNVVGSNIFNIGFILGVSGLIYPIGVHISLLRREIPIMIGVSLLLWFVILDGEINRFDGVVLFTGIIAFVGLMLYQARRDHQTDAQLTAEEAQMEAESEPPIAANQRLRELVRIILGLALLIVGAQLTLTNSVEIARSIGISELVIGLTLVAAGTSLPELATSAVAALRKQSDIAIGNVVGSNIFNILSILGLTSIVQPIGVNPQVLTLDIFVMMFFAIILMPFAFNRNIGRNEALLLLGAYIAYTIVLLLQ